MLSHGYNGVTGKSPHMHNHGSRFVFQGEYVISKSIFRPINGTVWVYIEKRYTLMYSMYRAYMYMLLLMYSCVCQILFIYGSDTVALPVLNVGLCIVSRWIETDFCWRGEVPMDPMCLDQ